MNSVGKKQKAGNLKKKKQWFGQIVMMAAFMLIGGVCGVFMAHAARQSGHEMNGKTLALLLLMFMEMYAAIFLQIVIHETGHLIFGMLTGYRFSSFRVASFMVIKKEGKLKLRRFSLAGTGGQCLMVPPEWQEGHFPYILYNLGGSLLNLLTAILCIVIAWLRQADMEQNAFLIMMALIGTVYALMNGIPLRSGTINNDGHNAVSLGKTPEALRSFWLQMKMNEQIAAGVRLKEMPEEWFAVPSDEGMKNSMTSALGVFACSRLMDEGKYAEADALMERLLSLDSGIVGIHRSLMRCDQIYCELIGTGEKSRIEKLLDRQQKKFMKAMKSFPSVVRTEYAYALLAEQDQAKAKKLLDKFGKTAARYPNPADIESERELIRYAQEIAEKNGKI